MRLWSLHPKYLDPRGLTALWRETLLARQVLRGQTRGYRHHPQLHRFRAQVEPLVAIDSYLSAVYAEAGRRGYRFDATKLQPPAPCPAMPVSLGQVAYEFQCLRKRLQRRSPRFHQVLVGEAEPEVHPVFHKVPGPVEPWERIRIEVTELRRDG
jgi:Pyrimidine dimer DNA glycosylase